MAAPDANSCFWGFWAYIKRNPFKPLGGMTETDLEDMRDLFIAENSDALSTTATYTDCEFPGAIQSADTDTARNQATYPEKHKSA